VTPQALFAVGTVLQWGGLFFGLAALARLASGYRDKSVMRGTSVRSGSMRLAASALGVLVSEWFLQRAQPTLPAQGIPTAWVVLPFSGWATVVCALAALYTLYLGWSGPSGSRRLQVIAWMVSAGIFAGIYSLEGDHIHFFSGRIPFTPTTLVSFAALAALAVYAMADAHRTSRRRGIGRALATHVALLAGCVVFGIPFLWLLLTSFKEDQDLVSSSGLVWTPRVQVTRPYFDRSDPLFQASFQGKDVQGSYIGLDRDGLAKLDILRPLALRGLTALVPRENLKEVPREVPVVNATFRGSPVSGLVVNELDDGRRRVRISDPVALSGTEFVANPEDVTPERRPGLRWKNYTEALEYLPLETDLGLVYLKNTLIIVVMSVLGTLLSSSLVAYGFSRLRFPGRDLLFAVLLATMMLPGAVTLLPNFFVFRSLGWIDTLYPLWVPSFFAGAFNVFMLRQFFRSVPLELEDAAKIDGCSYLRSYWSVMLPQIKPALAVVGIWTFLGAWNNFMGPLIYINSPEKMPISYAVQVFSANRQSEPALMMAFATMAVVPVLLLFFFAQRYFIEGVTLSGFGGR
jgi:multiple sugar transport system permease protein